jgi:hypothetical protein
MHKLRTFAVAPAGAALLATLGLAPAASASVPATLAPVLSGAAAGGPVIVVLKNQHTNLNLRTQNSARVAADRSDQAPVVAAIAAHGGTGVRRLTAPDAVAATLSAAAVSALRSNPSVAEIVPDVKVPLAPSQLPAATSATKVATGAKATSCPFNPAGPSRPLVEPEALGDINAPDAKPGASITGTGVIVANMGMNELAGNPNFQRPNGSHVVIDAPDYTANASNDEDYGDASSIAAQGTVTYQYAGALPYSDVPAGCSFVIKGDAPGVSLVDLGQVDTPIPEMSEVLNGIDDAVSTVHADVISESFGTSALPTSSFGALLAQANEAAVAAGVTVVESSGDSGDSGTVIAAADDPAVIATGAVDNFRLVAMAHDYKGYVSNNMAALSSGGTAPTNKVVDLVAPGYFGGEAACADGSGGCPPNYPTESMRGTSESAPLTAGAAADVIQAYRQTHGGADPSPALIKEILTGTATDIDSPVDQQGSGLLDIDAAVRAAEQMPGTTTSGNGGALISSPSQLDLSGLPGTVSDQTVSLYNAGAKATTVTGAYRWIGPERQLGRTATESVSAPPASAAIPPEGARAAAPVTFTVPRGLNRLDADMIWPDATNNNIICFALFDPRGRLEQLSYDDGNPSTTGKTGSVPDIQHAEVSDPEPGTWTAKILWSGKDVDLALPPATPGTYTGPMSFKVSGQDYLTSPATRPTTIPAHSSAAIPLRVGMPVAPGDHPVSVQFTARNGSATSLPVTRRTLIPPNGGRFQTLITSTVGRSIGQMNTYAIEVPAGKTDLKATFSTADISADNIYTFYLVGPSGTVVATGSTPQTVNGTPTGTVTLDAPDPATGTWTIDVVLKLTVSGKEFLQTVNADVQDS